MNKEKRKSKFSYPSIFYSFQLHRKQLEQNLVLDNCESEERLRKVGFEGEQRIDSFNIPKGAVRMWMDGSRAIF